MCGISGEIRFDGQPAATEAVVRMTAAMAARGPDGSGIVSRGPVAFGHRRLRVIDLSDKAQQPMVDAELGLTVVFNGCIYNYPELRDELRELGYRFFSAGDTEVVLKAWHAWGERCVDRMYGMFAFAVHERDSGRVALARDRFGIKPLYLCRTPSRLRFASSLPALLAGGEVDTSIDTVALHHYMSFHAVVPAPHTILNGVRKLPPATVRMFEPDGTHRDRLYWNPPFARTPADAAMSAEDWRDAVLASLRRAVDRRMIADVPVGVLLSGGVDSSLIVGLLAEAGQKGLQTFSVGFEEANGEKGDEFVYSDLIAKHYGTEHHKIFVPSANLMDALPGTIDAMSEPMVSYDNVGFYLLSKEVSRHVKVVQSGQGADEVFGGYHWYPPLLESRDPVADYARVFMDRDRRGASAATRSALALRQRCEPWLRRGALRCTGRGDGRRQGAEARQHGDAGRRPGEARRQHDDGLGAGSTGAVPRSRTGRAGGTDSAGAQAEGRRQGRAEGRRATGGAARGHRPAQRLLPGAAAEVHLGPVPGHGQGGAHVAARPGSADSSAAATSSSCSQRRRSTSRHCGARRCGRWRCWNSGCRTMASDKLNRGMQKRLAEQRSGGRVSRTVQGSRLAHRIQRLRLQGWQQPDRRPPGDGPGLAADVALDCGWGRLLFGETFKSPAAMVDALGAEGPQRRDIAFHVREPQVLLAQAPQEVFLDPSHTYRLSLDTHRPLHRRPGGFLIRRLASQTDGEAISRIYALRGMVPVDPAFFWAQRDNRALSYWLAVDEETGEVIGTVTGVDHRRAFETRVVLHCGASRWIRRRDSRASARNWCGGCRSTSRRGARRTWTCRCCTTTAGDRAL